MANNAGDDVALLKEELAQFLLGEIASAQGGQAFRREVSEQVGAVIDAALTERLRPTIDRLERQAAEQARQATALVDDALAKLKAAAPATDSAALERRLSDVVAGLEQLRQRIGRVEDQGKPRPGGATAQPIAPRSEPSLADERLAAPRPMGSLVPRWLLWLLLLLLALAVLGIGNLYYERLFEPAAPSPLAASEPTPVAPAPSTVPPSAEAPSPGAVSVPPQNAAAIPPVTPTPAPAMPPPQPAPHVPADFAIERGWLAAQPFAVDPRLARRAGSNEARPTLKSLVCGRSPNCASDALTAEGTDGKQLIALQMLMSQIGDRFCTPRRAVAVTGLVSATGLADLAAVAGCAGGTPATCRETQTKVCPPDPDALQSGSRAARSALLRWALWKTGST
ncbi:MAG TPA: hypothetical protein VGC36_10860 [Rhizomicrobium sp.]